MSAKAAALAALASLPEEASWNQILERLRLRALSEAAGMSATLSHEDREILTAITHSQAAAAAGQVKTQTEVEQEFDQWVKAWTAK